MLTVEKSDSNVGSTQPSLAWIIWNISRWWHAIQRQLVSIDYTFTQQKKIMSSRGTFVPYLNPLKHWKPPPRFTQITKNKGTCFFGTHRFGSFQPSCNWTSSQSWEMQHDSLIACRWQDLYLFFYDSTASSGTWTKNLKETSVRWLFWVVTIWVWSSSWVSTMELLEEAEKR